MVNGSWLKEEQLWGGINARSNCIATGSFGVRTRSGGVGNSNCAMIGQEPSMDACVTDRFTKEWGEGVRSEVLF